MCIRDSIITSYYGPTVMEIARRCGIEYDDYVEEHRLFTSKMELNPPCGKVMPGTISAHEFIMKCLRDGKEVTGFHFIHKVCPVSYTHLDVYKRQAITSAARSSKSINT